MSRYFKPRFRLFLFYALIVCFNPDRLSLWLYKIILFGVFFNFVFVLSHLIIFYLVCRGQNLIYLIQCVSNTVFFRSNMNAVHANLMPPVHKKLFQPHPTFFPPPQSSNMSPRFSFRMIRRTGHFCSNLDAVI